MSFSPVYIAAYDCLSPAGHGVPALMSALYEGRTFLGKGLGELPRELNESLYALRSEKSLRDQDKLSLMGVYLARRLPAVEKSSGVIMGSSRGAAASIEEAILGFHAGKRLKASTSPTTTASSLPSAIARELSLEGPSFFLSAACSTGLYAVIQGAANINVGLTDSCLVGGAEAANTDFTQEMMASTKVLSKSSELYPCQPFAENRKGMILSEGAALLHLSSRPSAFAIVGVGATTEVSSLTGVSEDGEALQRAIQKALDSADLAAASIDLIVGHGSGTEKGDQAEAKAYELIFGDKIPPLALHKWCGGHMLGASSALSVMLAIEHLKNSETCPHPYFEDSHPMRYARPLGKNRWALITSMGFGGSATALIVRNLMT